MDDLQVGSGGGASHRAPVGPRRASGRPRSLRSVVAIAIATALGLVGAMSLTGGASAATTVSVSGTVRCTGGHAVTGVWVESSGGGRGWATWKAVDPEEYPGGSMAYYYRSLSLSGTSSSVSLHVGCGAKSDGSWWSDNWSPSVGVSGNKVLNTTCAEAAGTGTRCGTPGVPSIGNRVADLALTYRGQNGAAACVSAGLGSAPGGYAGGECRTFVNCLVYRASWHRYYPTSSDYSFSIGGTEIAGSSATRGDIIQKGIGGHTAIILRNLGSGTYRVVDSNYNYDHIVRIHNWTPGTASTVRFWRYGQTTNDQRGAW